MVTIDVIQLLRELEMRVAEGRGANAWLLRAPNGSSFEVSPGPPVARLDAHAVRNQAAHQKACRDSLLVGGSATEGVVKRALEGKIDILTAKPIRLIRDGIVYETAEGPATTPPRASAGRLAWRRWAVERYLLLAAAPARQSEIASAVGTTQQSVSHTARHLGDLVADHGSGLAATDRLRLLEHWRDEYPGPGGHEFGWYSLDPATEQVARAAAVARLLGVSPLISGDVAADRIAPWKNPARGRLYVSGPLDLSENGFVPAPIDEATLITCTPRDPTLWRLIDTSPARGGSGREELADAALVYWEQATSDDIDSDAAAQHLAAFIAEGTA